MRTTLLVSLITLAFLAHAQVPCDVSVVVTSPTCPDDVDGSISVVAGTPSQYSYTWPQYPALQGPDATGLAAGAYTVIVTDTNGCYSQIDTVVAPLGKLLSSRFSYRRHVQGTRPCAPVHTSCR